MAHVKKRMATEDPEFGSKRIRAGTDEDQFYELSDADSVRSLSARHAFALSDTQSVAETTASTLSSLKRPKRYICDVEGCEKAFDRPVRLQAHQRTHTNERPFVCNEPDCPKAFFKAEHLKAHIQNKHSEDASHVCGYIVNVNDEGEEFECGKAFTTATRLRRHVAAHEQKESLKCQEPGCGLVFRKMDTLQRHVKNVHLNEKAFRCTQIIFEDGSQIPDECGREFTTIGQLKSHENREHAGLRYFCDVCSPPSGSSNLPMAYETTMDIFQDLDRVGFSTYAELQSHLKCAHPPTCEVCGQSCTTKRALAAHIDIEHSSLTDRQKYPCTYPDCSRSFTRHGNLKVHIQNVHVKHKRFICGQYDLRDDDKCPGWDGQGCGMAFGTKANLENHTRTQHLQLSSLSKRHVRIKMEEGTSNSASSMDIDEPAESGILTASADERNALSLLTGYGYAQTRPIPCWNTDCPVRFTRDFDLAQHMELTHGWLVDDINDRLAEESALSGDHFWIGGVQTSDAPIESYNNLFNDTQHASADVPLSCGLQCNDTIDREADEPTESSMALDPALREFIEFVQS